MQKQIIIVCALLINGTYSMQENYVQLAREAEQHNFLNQFVCLPLEIHQQMIFPAHMNDINIMASIMVPKMNELKEIIKTFFVYKIVCTNFNKNLKFPWSVFELEKKNKMLEGVLTALTRSNYHASRIVSLGLIYSGAYVDTQPKLWCTMIHEAVCENDVKAVAMLLKYNADPYQCDHDGTLICFLSKTLNILKLFLEKIDKNELLAKLSAANFNWNLLDADYSVELMEFWLDYGVDFRDINTYNECIFHFLVQGLYAINNFDNVIRKAKLLIKYVPDMINIVNKDGHTAMDQAYWQIPGNATRENWHHRVIELFKEHGGKRASELEEK